MQEEGDINTKPYHYSHNHYYFTSTSGSVRKSIGISCSSSNDSGSNSKTATKKHYDEMDRTIDRLVDLQLANEEKRGKLMRKNEEKMRTNDPNY